MYNNIESKLNPRVSATHLLIWMPNNNIWNYTYVYDLFKNTKHLPCMAKNFMLIKL